MRKGSFGARGWFVAIAFVLALVPRGTVIDSAATAERATGKQTGAPIVLAQGRCFNGKCY
jgi:hypothetical protein